MMLPFVERGYSVLIPDYSGYGFSEGKATRRHVKEDGIAALKYLRGTGEDLGALILYGQSLGGHLAPCVAAEHQDLIDALVVEGAFSSHDDVAVALAKLGFFARWMTREMYSAKRSIAEFHKPVLVVHSREDATIPFAMGERLFGAANGPKTFLPIDQCHVCGPFYYPDSISDHMLRMVEGARGGTP
ncbi:MAG: alpha/beta hydrolase [Flavobacteriales bacterium]|nr:alpha/beta hydrolase [Flavobacteriales bacterium]